jgi:putative thioredoxin
MSDEAFILEGTDANFATLVLENSRKGPVLVDFWASWAGPSLRQGELLRRLARDYGGRFLLVSVDTDREKAVAHRYGVKGLPSCKLFRQGKIAEEVHGMQTEADYRALIDRHLRPLADRAQAAALAAWEAGDQDKAVQVLAEAAMADPENPAVPLLLAKLLIRQGRHADAEAVLAALPPVLRAGGEIRRLFAHVQLITTAADAKGSVADLTSALDLDRDNHTARLALGASLVMADDYHGALEQFVELERRAPDLRDGLAREAVLLVLDLLGPDDAQVRRYRRSLFGH